LPPDINLVLLFRLNLKAMGILIKGIKEKDFIIDQKDSLAIKLSMLIDNSPLEKI